MFAFSADDIDKVSRPTIVRIQSYLRSNERTMFKGRLRRARERLGSERTDVVPTSTTSTSTASDQPEVVGEMRHSRTVSDASVSIPENDVVNNNEGDNNPAIMSVERSLASENYQTSELCTFDACVEAADAMAANDSGRSSTTPAAAAVDPAASPLSSSAAAAAKNAGIINDCSVLVSPDGALLFLPNEQQQQHQHVMGGIQSEQNFELLSNMYPTEEVKSAIVTGSDLHPSGDRLANGFSARGWAPDAASLALRRSEEALRSTGAFMEELAALKRQEASKIGGALCDKFRNDIISSADTRAATSATPAKSKKKGFGRSKSEGRRYADDGDDADAMISSSFSRENKLKTSPLFFPGSTLHAAATSVIQYHTASARGEQVAAQSEQQSLAKIQAAAEKTSHRAANREAALSRAHRRVEEVEAVLTVLRAEAKRRWDEVHKVEGKVRRVYEERVRERSRELYNRKRASDENLHRLTEKEATGEQLESGVTQAEIWELVNQIGSEESSFHPIGLPEAPKGRPVDKSLVDDELDQDEEEEFENDDGALSANIRATPPPSSLADQSSHPPLPPVDRGDVEFELNLPSLRAAALEADSDVEDAATSLLNALSALDTTHRSARIAAESALLSAANVQAEAMRCMVQQERSALEAKLKQLNLLERQVNSMDVRADLDAYIAFDRRERPGSTTRLGDDDDGGIASALAVLDGHAEGNEHGKLGASQSLSSFERFGGGSDATGGDDELANDKHKGIALSREEIGKVIANLFAERENDDYEEGAEDLDDAGSLVLAVSLRSSRGRSCRASTCYALNHQRSVRTEISTNEQFDGLCRVFYALLKGCDTRVPSDVANAKMCMMLSQTFYVVDHEDVLEEKEGAGNAVDERKKRLYINSTLVNHPFFSHEDFWVQALFQCVTESLVGSGVVASNFERTDANASSTAPSRHDAPSKNKQSKWFELNKHEREEAASQVHAVIFAQLGALSHSMVEFGCDVEQACAFVRRLSIQHQLPLSQRTMLLQHLIGRQGSSVENEDVNDAADAADTGVEEDEPAVDDNESTEHAASASVDNDAPTPKEPAKRLIVLLSRGVSDRNQSAHQEHCLTILKARKTPYKIVDGMDQAQRDRRDMLFSISGVRGHYPQFFMSFHNDEGEETELKFVGGYDRLKDLNDTLDIGKDILQANPDLETWDRLFADCA